MMQSQDQRFFSQHALVISLILSAGIAATEVPIWMTAFTFTMILWKFFAERWQVWKLPKRLTSLLGGSLFLIVYIQYNTILGQEESSTVLLGLMAISILNYETERDSLFLVLLGFLVVVIKSIFSLDFIWTLPALISFFGLWYALVQSKKLDKRKYLFWTAVKSIPLFLFLFFLFPRLALFQNRPSQRLTGKTEFSEDLNPGRISEIVTQEQLVFRADFFNNQMNAEELYWRGAVLSVSRGLSWQKGVVTRQSVFTSDWSEPDLLTYRVLLEPMNMRNIFLLETPARVLSASAPVAKMPYNLYVTTELLNQTLQYQAQARLNSSFLDTQDPPDQRKYLGHPELPAKTKAFVDEVRSRQLSQRQIVSVLQKFFSEKGFIYTLKPDTYGESLDEFLFERRKGFCEHYAAAFATLVRALGIPSRVVIGYQGGAYNSMGQFWKVSQKDAHAWTEIGLDGKWVRVDPTAWVSPLRISLGGEEFFSLNEDEQILYSKNRAWRKSSWVDNFATKIRFAFDNLNFYWTVMLLNYDLQTQLSYWRDFQGSSIYGAAVVVILALGFFYRRNRFRWRRFGGANIGAHGGVNKERYELSRLVIEIEKWAAGHGLNFEKTLPPLSGIHQIQKKFPQLTLVLGRIAKAYEDLIYREQASKERPKSLSREWKKATKS